VTTCHYLDLIDYSHMVFSILVSEPP